MSIVIPVAHDYICPWCWIALSQTERLKKEFGVTFDWVGYELMPEELDWPDSPAPAAAANSRRAPTPSRLDLALAAEGIEVPKVDKPKKMRSYNALEAAEHAKAMDVFDAFNERMYRAFWEEGREINSLDVICELAGGLMDADDLRAAVESKRYKDKIVPFDDEAYEAGVYNVPTYFIGGEKFAEQPTRVLAEAIRKELGR